MLLLILAQLASAAPAPAPVIGKDQGTISVDDYPLEALKKGWEGDVHVDLTVGTSGQVTACTVTQSSGHDVLDTRTCAIMASRARFEPAFDQSGQPIESHFQTHVVWKIAH